MNLDINAAEHRQTRHPVVRVAISLVWFVSCALVFLWILTIAGGLIAAGQAESEAAALEAIDAWQEDFLDQYFSTIILFTAALVFSLSWYQLLPGTNKFRGKNQPISGRWFAAPVWLRFMISLLLVFLCGTIWGFLAALLGASGSIISLGAVAIAAAMLIALNRNPA